MEVTAGIYKNVIFPGGNSSDGSHLSDLQKAMLDATPDCIKIVAIDGKLLTMNKAGCLALGVPEDSEFGMPWLSLLPAEVHSLCLEALNDAVQGQNARFPGKSLSVDGIRHWDSLLTPIVDASGRVLSILCVSRDVTAQTQLKTDLEAAIDRANLLSREMQHRIKNLFSVVSGLISISEREAAEGNGAETATKVLREKLSALARASDAAFSIPDAEDHDLRNLDINCLVTSVLKPYGDRYHIVGQPLSISHNNMTTLALFLHELATNSVKYGAFNADGGNVTIEWKADGEELSLTWAERGGPPIPTAPHHQGFGSRMVDRIVQSAGGSVSRSWPTQGLIAQLHLPSDRMN